MGIKVGVPNKLVSPISSNKLSPNWQKRGIGIYWEEYKKDATNLKTGEAVKASRRRLKVDYELPMKDLYSDFISNIIVKSA